MMRTRPLCALSIMEECMTEMKTAACILVNCQRTTEAMRERRRLPRVGGLERETSKEESAKPRLWSQPYLEALCRT
jgi:hypothetical protein